MDNSNIDIFCNYKEVACRMLSHSFPTLNHLEIQEAVNWSIDKRKTNHPVKIDNNYKKEIIETTLEDLLLYLYDRQPIVTHFGVMFSKHGTVPNPILKMIQKFIDNRKAHKATMFTFPKGTEDFAKYNLLQLLDKIDANGFYGAMGKFSCIYYNIYVASSITTEGRNLNAAAALLFESILANNVPFGSLNEVITFIDNVCEEPKHFKDYEILDNNVSVENTFSKVILSCGFDYIPDEKDLQIVWNILCDLPHEALNRIYYKNNLYEFCSNSRVIQSIIYMISKLDTPYINPNKPPEIIKQELEIFKDLIFEYIYYDQQVIDRTEKMETLIRTCSVIQDTDSAIICMDAWYRFINDKVINSGLKIPIMNMEVDITSEEVTIVTQSDYDFINDEIIEIDRTVTPNKIVPQDNLKFTIINILCYCMSNMINDFMVKYTKNSNSYNPEQHPCFLSMKNEFYFKRVMLMENAKKHYASYQSLQEGNIIPEDEALDIKGIDCFVKSTMNSTTREQLKQVLLEDILKCDQIDQVKIMKDLAIIEKGIYNSIQNGEKKYYKPARVKSLNSYSDPMRIQGIKASLVYNAVRDESMTALNMESRNSIDIIKTNITPKNVYKIKESNPDIFMKLVNIMKSKEFETGIDAIALPESESVPEWILQFVDYTSIINDCVSLFPIESVGLYRGNNNNNYTNIINM